jgi:mannose-6-phosphate isomerase-like protein (cupin superfamily)
LNSEGMGYCWRLIPSSFVEKQLRINIIGYRSTNERKEMIMEILFTTESLAWVPHPTVKDVFIKKIITMEKYGPESPSIIMVRVPAGVVVPEHVHTNSEDILFILSGAATMWIDGAGEMPLRKGTVVRVPRNTKHRIFDITEELLVYDVFSPGIM